MAYYENHAPVSNLAHVQNIHGNVIFNTCEPKPKRSRYSAGASNPYQSLDDDIVASLAFPEMLRRRSDIESAHPETCQWLLGLDEFQHWRSGSDGLLWIKGKPGSGKSTLISHLYRTLWLERQIDRDINLEFFFTARGTLLQRTFVGMLRSLMIQIFQQDFNIRQKLRTLYLDKCSSFGNNQAAWEWTLAELKSEFMDIILASAQRHQIVLLVDALDEAGTDTARAIASYLHAINVRVIASASTAKIAISCRHYPIPSIVKAVEIHMERYNHDDIVLYIEDNISGNPIASDRQHLDTITEALVDKANGVFQWIGRVIPMVNKWLDECKTTEQILRNLSEVPKDLAAMYEHILTNVVDLRYRKKTLRLFQWVCLAQRPLSVPEIRYALSTNEVGLGARLMKCHEMGDFETSDSNMCRRITTWSGGLLEIRMKNLGAPQSSYLRSISDLPGNEPVVQVIHQSVNDFMLTRGLPLLLALSGSDSSVDNGSLRLETSTKVVEMLHGTLYLSCLSYLCVECPSGSLSGIEQYPLLRYSACFGHVHAKKSNGTQGIGLENEALLLDQSFPTWILTIRMLKGEKWFDDRPLIKTGITVLHFASMTNLVKLAEFKIKNGDNLNAEDTYGWTPVHMAAFYGHFAMVTLLSKNGADIQRSTRDGNTPLLLAAGKGYEEMFGFLLSLGANIHAENEFSANVLRSAARAGSLTIVRLCVESGVDVNDQGGYNGTALQMAVSYGHRREIFSLLLGAGADVNAQGGYYGNALQAAAYRGDRDTVSFLLDAGADVNAQGGHYGNALQAAVHGGDRNTVSLLLDAGADINAQGGHYGNALQAAVCEGDRDTVSLILDAGADVNAQGGFYGNALQAAAYGGSRETVRLLLDAGADVNVQGGDCSNALRAAQMCGDMSIVDMLLAAGAT